MSTTATTPDTKRNVPAWTAGIIGSVLLALAIALALLDWNALRKPIANYASHHLHRPVAIEGDLRVHLFSWAPRIEINGLSIGNPDWDKAGAMAGIDRLALRLKLMPLFIGRLDFDSIRLQHAQVKLHRNTAGQANWEFSADGNAEASTAPLKLPTIHALAIEDSHIEIKDEQRHLNLSAQIQALDEPAGTGVQVNGKGSLNGQPFSLQLRGDSLLTVNAGNPYDFDLDVTAGDIAASVNGRAAKAFDFSTVNATFKVSGEDLADLYYLTGLALPNTPRYQLSADVARHGQQIDLRRLAGRLGSSDINGELAVDLSAKRPRLTGIVASRELNLADLSAPLGAHKPGVDTLSTRDAKAAANSKAQRASGAGATPGTATTTAGAANTLLPDAQLQVNRLRGMDADVRYSAASIKTEKMPLEKFSVHILLDDGVLKLQPLVFDFPQGSIAATAVIDATREVPQTHLDLRITNVKLEQFAKPGTTPSLTGSLLARVKLSGRGKSVHEVAADSNGSLTVVVPHGEIRKAFAELTGVNIDRGVGLIIFNDHETSTVRCGVANFAVVDGDMKAQNIVIDTDSVLITGSGDINLRSEAINLAIKGQPKKLRLLRLRTPILVRGDLKKPRVGVDVAKSALQAGVATAIGTLLTPLAAVIAFVDPGLKKNADCSALLSEAENKVQSPIAPRRTAPTPRR